jgi:hypothetical protein
MEKITTITMSYVLKPFSFVLVFIFPYMHPVPLSFSIDPLSNIRVAASTLPHAIAVFDTHVPLPIVAFTVYPCVNAFTMRFTIAV